MNNTFSNTLPDGPNLTGPKEQTYYNIIVDLSSFYAPFFTPAITIAQN